jgi:hypothetical protein
MVVLVPHWTDADFSVAAVVLSQEAERLREGFSELTLTVDMLERERDFYYNKLRAIELLCMEVMMFII